MDHPQYQHNLTLLAAHSAETSLVLRHIAPQDPPPIELLDYPADVQVVFILGVEGVSARAQHWLEEGGVRLIVLESDPHLAASWVATKEAGRLLTRCRLVLIEGLSDPILDQLDALCEGRPAAVLITEGFRSRCLELTQPLATRLLEGCLQVRRLFDEFRRHSERFYRNFSTNLSLLNGAHNAAAFWERFAGYPAIICAAGPSLDHVLPQLSQLTSRALVLAPGSSFPALMTNGIRPHFGVGIDPHSDQLKRLQEVKEITVPFFYRSRWYPPALAYLSGPRLYVRGAGGYPIAEWFEEQLDIEGPVLEEGQNVVHFATEIARYLGCNPIVFVGLDLAFSNGQDYASGVGDRIYADERIEAIDIAGRPIQTLLKWTGEARWLAEYAQDHPEIELMNATGGGIGIEGVPNVSLNQVSASWPPPNDLEHKILSLLAEGQIIHTDQIGSVVETFRQSIIRAKNLYQKLQGNPNPLDEFDLHQEIAYQTLIENLPLPVDPMGVLETNLQLLKSYEQL